MSHIYLITKLEPLNLMIRSRLVVYKTKLERRGWTAAFPHGNTRSDLNGHDPNERELLLLAAKQMLGDGANISKPKEAWIIKSCEKQILIAKEIGLEIKFAKTEIEKIEPITSKKDIVGVNDLLRDYFTGISHLLALKGQSYSGMSGGGYYQKYERQMVKSLQVARASGIMRQARNDRGWGGDLAERLLFARTILGMSFIEAGRFAGISAQTSAGLEKKSQTAWIKAVRILARILRRRAHREVFSA